MREPNRTERARWVNEIRENPDDDGVRLRCASWFAAQGGEANVARAEFILTQIERARLPADSRRYSELNARELQLVIKHWRTWCAGSRLLRRPIFRRGFVERVHVHLREFYWHRRELFALEPVRDVRFTGWHRTPDEFVQRVARCEELRHLEALAIHHQGPHKDPADSVVTLLESPYLSELRTLETTYCGFKPETVERFRELPVVRHVESLTLPTVDRFDWDAEPLLVGRPDAARSWGFSKKLAILETVTVEALRACSEAPGWNSLAELAFADVRDPEGLENFLVECTPPALSKASLDCWGTGPNREVSQRCAEVLARLPLRSVRFGADRVRNAALIGLLDSPAWQIEHFASYDPELLPLLVGAASLRYLRFLDISVLDQSLADFADMGGADEGTLVRARFEHDGEAQPETLVRFLRSRAAAGLVSLSSGGPLTSDVAAALCDLPWLTHLRWGTAQVAPEVRQMLEARLADGRLELTVYGRLTPDEDEADEREPQPSRAEQHIANGASSVIPLDGYVD